MAIQADAIATYLAELTVVEDEASCAMPPGRPPAAPPRVGRRGAFLRFAASWVGAQAVEIGSGAGYSGVWIARGLAPKGILTTIEVDPAHQGWPGDLARRPASPAGSGRSWPAPSTSSRITDGGYDLASWTRRSPSTPSTWSTACAWCGPAGVIIADNVLWSGRVADPKVTDPRGAAAYARHIAADDRLDSVILTVGDGLAVSRCAATRSGRPDPASTTTYIGGRSGPPDGDERPLRGLPGGAPVRPVTSPGPTPARRRPGGRGRRGWCVPCGPLRSCPGAPPHPCGGDPRGRRGRRPRWPTGTGRPPRASYPLPRPDPGPGQAGGTVAAAGEAALAGRPWPSPCSWWRLAVTGRVVAELRYHRAGAPPATASPAGCLPARPSPIVATVATGGFSSAMATGAGASGWSAATRSSASTRPPTRSRPRSRSARPAPARPPWPSGRGPSGCRLPSPAPSWGSTQSTTRSWPGSRSVGRSQGPCR